MPKRIEWNVQYIQTMIADNKTDKEIAQVIGCSTGRLMTKLCEWRREGLIPPAKQGQRLAARTRRKVETCQPRNV